MSGNTAADSAVVVALFFALLVACVIAYWVDRGRS